MDASRDLSAAVMDGATIPPCGRRDDTWIQTYTGRQFWPLDPRPDDIDILDIAHALAMKCRFTGHTLNFYSVAQHSVIMARNCPPALRLWALLHDAGEAYLPDVARPVKRRLPGFQSLENRILRCIAKRFDLPWPMPDEIGVYDLRALATERQDLMATPPRPWRTTDTIEPFAEKLFSWTPTRAEAEFLEAWDQLSCPASSASASQPIPTTAPAEPALSSAARRA